MLDDKALSDEETSLNIELTDLRYSSKSIVSEMEKGELANVVSLINTTKASQESLISHECYEPIIQLLDFIPAGNTDFGKAASNLLGSFISYTKIKSFQLPIDPFCMALSNNGNVWITDRSELIECYTSDKMEIVRSIECIRSELGCSTESNDLLFLTEHEIKKLNAFGVMKKIYDFSPYKSTTFHVSKENELTVTLELQLAEQSNKKYLSRIVVLDIKGKIKQEYNFKEAVIVDCNSIVKTSDGLFCFTTQETQDNPLRRIKMMNRSRNIVWEYPLNLSKEATIDNFLPGQLIESREGNIIMTELTCSALHILDKAGQILKVLSALQFGIQRPSLIAPDSNGNLWIAGRCSKFENPILCVLETTGF